MARSSPLTTNEYARFQLLQKWQKQASAPLAYYLFDLLLFDLLWAEGMDATAEAVLERRRATNRDHL
jgi:hypothetical protein